MEENKPPTPAPDAVQPAQPPKPPDDDSNSLESLESESESTPQHSNSSNPNALPDKKKSIVERLKGLVAKLNVYMLAFLLIVIVGLIILFVSYNASQKTDDAVVNTQELTQDAIDKLVGSDTIVGDPKQLLTVESNAVFSGKVLIRDGLDVAGPIKVGGSLSLPGITVSGASAFDQVTVNALSIAGDANVQGQLSVSQGLTVSGPVTFSGTFSAAAFNIQSLQVNEDIQLNRHIDAGGASPGASAGGALGSGGTISISGTDTAGTVTANVGSGAAAGVLATITFSKAFTASPHVVITPVAAQGSALITGNQNYYLSTRTSTGFSIAVSGALPAGSISFDYIVID